MDWERSGVVQVGDTSAKAEARFKKLLEELTAAGATAKEISKAVTASAFVLGLVWCVTSAKSSKNLRGWKGHRPPMNWEDWLKKNAGGRDEWRCETVRLLLEKCNRHGTLGCDLSRESIGGFWRLVIADKAVKAAWSLWKESRFVLRHGGAEKTEVKVATSLYALRACADNKAGESVMECHVELAMAVDSLVNSREREVMSLLVHGWSYDKVAEMTGLTKDQVRYAAETARAKLMGKLGGAA